MLVGVRAATTVGDHVGELNLRIANLLGSAPASTSDAGNVIPTAQVSKLTPSLVTLYQRFTDLVALRFDVPRFGWSPAVVAVLRLPATDTLPNARLSGVSCVSVPISNDALTGPVASPFLSRPTTRPLVRDSGAPAASASVFVPVLMLPPPRSTAPPEPIVYVRPLPASARPAVPESWSVEPVNSVALTGTVSVPRDAPAKMSLFVPVLFTIGCVVATLVEVRFPSSVTWLDLPVNPPKPPPVADVVRGAIETPPVTVRFVVPVSPSRSVPPLFAVPAVPPNVRLRKLMFAVPGAFMSTVDVDEAKFMSTSPNAVPFTAWMFEANAPAS